MVSMNSAIRMIRIASLVALYIVGATATSKIIQSGSNKISPASRRCDHFVRNRHVVLRQIPRGGETSQASTSPKKRTKKKKKKKTTATGKKTKAEKKVIEEAMREKDAAAALGDAIRERADVLKADSDNPMLHKIDESVASVGYAMGSSDTTATELFRPEEDGGGVEAAPMSVLANYFLKSHGGAHAVQCVCSLLALLCSVGAVLLPAPKTVVRLVLIRRAMLFAMTKHMSGVLAATSMAATAIPEVGLRQARKWIEKLAKDPVSQYIFYAALVLLWLPTSSKEVISIPWWYNAPLTSKLAPLSLVGPVLLREAVSTAFVVSDILVLLSTSAGQEDKPRILQLSTSIVNAGMSILVTPKVWRSADSEAKQAMLAKLTSRLSLSFELFVGLLLVFDALMAVGEFSFSPPEKRPVPLTVIKRLVCTRLYLNFLWVRRRKIAKLARTLRGGGSQIPFRVIDVLMNPKAAMGIESNKDSTDDESMSQERHLSWKDFARLGFTES